MEVENSSIGRTDDSFECDSCGRIFLQSRLLIGHIERLHSMAHKCSECQEKFDTAAELRTHRSHSHPTLKKCSVCDYQNRLAFQVKRHEKQVHGESAIPCTIPGCSMLFTFNKLKRHIKEKHLDAVKTVDCKSDGKLSKKGR